MSPNPKSSGHNRRLVGRVNPRFRLSPIPLFYPVPILGCRRVRLGVTSAMAQILNLTPPTPSCKIQTSRHQHNSTLPKLTTSTSSAQSWTSLSRSLKCKGRYTCLFSDNRRQEEARKALDNALGGKKTEFEQWDKEIKRREEVGGGGNSGGGGWFGWGGWFGGSNGDHFWQEAQQACLTVLGIILISLIVAKGDVMLAVICNPLLFTLRGPRTALAFLTSKITNRTYNAEDNLGAAPAPAPAPQVSAKERVVGKWGSN